MARDICRMATWGLFKTKQISYVLYMDASLETFRFLELFQRVAPERYFRELCQKYKCGLREEVYTADVVVWLMIWQRLRKNASQAAAVQYLVQSEAADLRRDCKRWNEDTVSGSTGSYCDARQRLPKALVEDVT